MRRNALLRGAIGFAVGLGLWLGVSQGYNPIVGLASQQLFHLVEHPNVTYLEPEGGDLLLHRTDFDPRSPRPQIPVRDLTFNVILLLALLAAAGPPLTLSKGGRWIAALSSLFAVHVAALSTKVMALYVLRLGEWSRVHYGSLARDFWTGADHFYRFIGIYAAAFAIWWLVREPEGEAAPPQSRPRSRRR